MNGDKLMGETYRKILYGSGELSEDEKDELEIRIKACDLLAEVDERDIFAMFESTAFIDMIKGYVCGVMKEYSQSPEVQADILEKFQESLEKLRLKDVLDEWNRHKSR